MSNGYILTIDGCEYAVATAGFTALPTSTDSLWPSDLTLLSDALQTPRITIRERAKPLDGDLDVEDLTFRLLEVVPASGEAANQRWMTYLASRRATSLTQTVLDTATGNLNQGVATVVVDSTTGFPASGVIYINREAIAYSGTTATSFTGCARGRYGSLDSLHRVDATYSFTPIVWGAWPGFEGRRCILWRVDAGVATCMWIGVIRSGPRLAAGDDIAAGAVWEIGCEHIWNYEKELRVGIDSGSTEFVGWNAGYLIPWIKWGGESYSSWISPTLAVASQPDLEAACALHQTDLNNHIRDASVTGTAEFSGSHGTVTLRFRASGVTGPIYTSLAIYGGPAVGATASTEPSGTFTSVTTTQGMPDVTVFVPGASASGVMADLTYRVDTVAGLPPNWSPTSLGDATYVVTSRYVLAGMLDEDTRVVLEPTSASSAPPSVSGVVRVISLRTGRDQGTRDQWLVDPPSLRVMSRINATRWLDAIRYGVTSTNVAVNPIASVDSRNWDWDTYYARILALTESSASERVLYLDGSRTVGQLVADQFKWQGVGIGIRNGRVCPFVYMPPLTTDTVTALTTADLQNKSTWGRNPDGIVNSVAIETDSGRVVVNDQLSIARFGQGRQMALRMVGSDDRRLTDPDPSQIVQHVMSRVLNLWNAPTYVRTVRVSLARWNSIFIGDYVTITEWLTPNGSGGRGPSATTSQVIGKAICLEERGYVELDLLEYAQQYTHPFAPCCRVTSISGGDIYVSNTSTALGNSTITDFAGSRLASYRGTPGDGGVSMFAVNDSVKLIRRNVTTVIEETGLKVTAISPSGTPGSSYLTVTPAPTTVPGTDEWHLVFDNYGNGSGVTPNMANYAWIANSTTRVIGTSTTPAQRWAP